MHWEIPVVPKNYVDPLTVDELVRVIELIHHATAPFPSDDAYHEAAFDLADSALKKVYAREAYLKACPERK